MSMKILVGIPVLPSRLYRKLVIGASLGYRCSTAPQPHPIAQTYHVLISVFIITLPTFASQRADRVYSGSSI